MPAFTLGRLAKLYGFHRSSVYEAVAKGRVSAGFDRNGQRVIDLSEALRVWGEPPTNPTPQPDTQAEPDTRHPTPQPAILAELLEELRQMRAEQQAEREENRRLREDLAAMREEVAGLRVALLEHKPAGIEEPKASTGGRHEKKSEPTTNAAPTQAKSFADLLEALND